jgi:hypothetical protein
MKAYSEDLRGRVIRSVETGRPREEVAAHCEVFSVPGLIGADDHIATLPGWTVARVHQFVDAIAAATDRNPDDLVQTAFTRAQQRHKRECTTYRQLG